MTTLAKDAPRVYELGEFSDCPVIATDIIYEGAAVGDNGSGYARPLVAGDVFLGFAKENADNAAGSAGDIKVHVQQEGKIQLAISSLAIGDIGKPVYASDDATFTLTQGSNSHIGRVARWVSTGIGIIAFDVNAKQGIVAALAGTLTGTTDGTMVDVAATAGSCAGGSTPSAAQVDAAIATAVASIVTGINVQNKELMVKLNAVIANAK